MDVYLIDKWMISGFVNEYSFVFNKSKSAMIFEKHHEVLVCLIEKVI